MRFNSKEYVDAFVRIGKFPSIHDNIFNAIMQIGEHFDTVVDLGCCTGLLSQRVLSAGICNKIIGFEPNKSYLDDAVVNSRIQYVNYAIEPSIIDDFTKRICGAGLIIARRVFPEIADTAGVAFVKRLSQIFADNGVKYIAIEGRKKVNNPVNKLHCIELEADCFTPQYNIYINNKDTIILKVK